MDNLIKTDEEWYQYRYIYNFGSSSIEIDIHLIEGDLVVDLENLSKSMNDWVELYTLKEITEKLTEIEWYIKGQLDKEKEIKKKIESEFL